MYRLYFIYLLIFIKFSRLTLTSFQKKKEKSKPKRRKNQNPVIKVNIPQVTTQNIHPLARNPVTIIPTINTNQNTTSHATHINTIKRKIRNRTKVNRKWRRKDHRCRRRWIMLICWRLLIRKRTKNLLLKLLQRKRLKRFSVLIYTNWWCKHGQSECLSVCHAV